jgi:hypothetical protein
MHAPFPARPRVLRLVAIAFALGLVMVVAPVPKVSFHASASAQISPVTGFEAVGDATLRTQQGVAEDPIDDSRVTTVQERTGEFTMIGVGFAEVPTEPVLVRVLDERGAWSEWNELEVDRDKGPDLGTPEAAQAAPGGAVVSEPLWVDAATGYELSVGEGDAEDVKVSVVREELRRVVTEAVPYAEAVAPAPFGIETRHAWGARPAKNTPSVASGGLKLAVVHHTASSNNYSAAQVPGILRSMQAFHMDGNGWSDIGYNFLVDKYGRIWEGRGGGTTRPVVGAHAAGFNTGSVGVSIIGNHTGSNASAAAREGVSRVIGYKLQAYRVHPQGRVNFRSGGSTTIPAGQVVNLPTVVGHRDVGSTACPGLVYGSLGSIRHRAAEWANLVDALVSPGGTINSVRVNGSTVEVSGWARDPDVASPARVHVVLAGRLKEITASGYRPDVGSAYPGYGDHRGWGAGFWDVPEGTHRLCVTVINQGEGFDRLLGCRDVVVK